MLAILRGEGWELKERELTKIRKLHGLLMREPNSNLVTKKRKRDALEELTNQNGQSNCDMAAGQEPPEATLQEPTLPSEVIAKRQARQEKLLAESQERLKAGTRRRRTKVWAGLPPDPDAPPRYPSELTMEENKKILRLDKALYNQLRDTFMDICQANNVIKKTLCGTDMWKNAKNELISKVPHLKTIFWEPGSDQLLETQEPMALDLICMDVTKKMRTVGNRVTITDAKNILTVTPQEGRDIRATFDDILKADHFTSKLEVSKEYWENLKAIWIARSPRLQQILADGDRDPDYVAKLKSLESIACDVQKRHRDNQTKIDPNRSSRKVVSVSNTTDSRTTTKQRQQENRDHVHDNRFELSTTNTTLAMGTPRSTSPQRQRINSSNVHHGGMTDLASQALKTPYSNFDGYSSIQIDPTLLAPVSLPPSQANPMRENNIQVPKPVYFRLSPTSHLRNHTAPKIWLDTLHPPHTLGSLRALAINRSGLRGKASIGRIEGLAAGAEQHSRWGIDEDDELEAYLEHVGNGKATFVVELV